MQKIELTKEERKLSEEEGVYLLALAREAIEAKLKKICAFPRIKPALSAQLQQKRGLFVGLWKGTEMRGCLGSPFSKQPLESAVMECAIQSALEDPRFTPINAQEFPHIKIELSILTTPKPIQSNQLQLGKQGVFVFQEGRSSVLLPHVALDENLSLKSFLEMACLKAGLSKHAWQNEASLYAFEVQVFQECPKE